MHKTAVSQLKAALKPGKVYRRRDLAKFSTNIDRHLSQLLEEGALRKIRQGIYACPSPTAFGEALPDEHQLLKTFLRDEHFVVFSPSVFNSLGLGTTQLYNERIVLNRKRHGEFALGSRKYFFHRRLEVPTQKQANKEYFVVELLNRIHDLAEDYEAVLCRLKENLPSFDQKKLLFAKEHYATYSAQLKFDELMAPTEDSYAT